MSAVGKAVSLLELFTLAEPESGLSKLARIDDRTAAIQGEAVVQAAHEISLRPGGKPLHSRS